MFANFFKKKPPEPPSQLVLFVRFGGYYGYKQDGKYGFFRLLDFNVRALHYALFAKDFDRMPTFEEALKEQPAVMHIPQGAACLFYKQELKLLGSDVLTEEALEGYATYLENAIGLEAAAIEQHVKQLIFMSHQPTDRLVLLRDPDNENGVLLKE